MRPQLVSKEPMAETIFMPHTPETEEQVLATALFYPETAPHVVQGLTGEDFYNKNNRRIFFALNYVLASGELAGAPAVCHQLRQAGLLTRVGGFQRIYEILGMASNKYQLDLWMQRLKAFTALRKTTQLGCDMQQQTYDTDDPGEILDKARDLIGEIAQDLVPTSRRPGLADNMDRVMTRIRFLNQTGELPGLSTGFPKLDELMLGFQGGALYFLGARSGTGKTHLAVDWTCKLAAAGHHVGMISLETSGDSFSTRMLANVSRLNSNALRRGMIGPREWPVLERAAATIAELPVTVVERGARRLSELARTVRALVRKGAKLIILDHIQLLLGDDENARKQQVVERGGQILKELALELGVPILALAQLNREAEGERPERHHLKDAGIEADADVIFLLHRADKDSREIELIVAKNRDGEEDSVNLFFNPGTSAFFNSTDEMVRMLRAEV